MMNYPRLTINLAQVRHNIDTVTEKCKKFGIRVAGVNKVTWGDPEVARVMDSSNLSEIASSRIAQLEKMKKAGLDKPLMLIRVPMASEADRIVKTADISLHSDLDVLKAFNRAAEEHGKKHKVILMIEMGDLREGIWDHDELMNIVNEVEYHMPGLVLSGVGTNLGCYGSILSTPEKMTELVQYAREIEEKIGRKLEYVSGGGTRAFARVLEGNMPEGINHLRIGCCILLARELNEVWGMDLSEFYHNIFNLQAEILEVRKKPTHPFGEIGVDAFRNKPTYEDRGVRTKALLGVGKADFGQDLSCLKARDAGIEIVGASSDHLIVDVEDAGREFHSGEVITIGLDYGAILACMASPEVRVEYINSAEHDYL